MDYFDWKLALNEQTGSVVPGAVAQVFAITDTAFATPLAITDMSDVPLLNLTASPNGLYPPFKVTTGQTQVLVKSGDVVTPVTSLLGAVLGVVPDPGDGVDGQVLGVEAGEYVLVDANANEVPDPSTGENGQILGVVAGEYELVDLDPASPVPDPSTGTLGDAIVITADGYGLAPFPIGGSVPDATTLPDDQIPITLGGGWSTIALPTGGGGSGREIQLQANATHLQWRYVGDAAWQNLIALSELKGAPGTSSNGESPQLRVSGGYFQWKLPSSSTWTNLLAVADLGAPTIEILPAGSTITVFGNVARPTARTDITVQWVHTVLPTAFNSSADLWLNT
jgi:hypothetical protein